MTPLEARKIRGNSGLCGPKASTTHPLEGKSVAQWVAEARAGWPKVPVPKDPFAAAQRVLKKHGSVEFDDAP